MKNYWLSLLLTGFWLCNPSQGQAVELKIASWNIYWLTEESNGNNTRREGDYRHLRRYAKSLDADIIALQEVENEQAAFRVFGPDYMYYFAGRKGGGQQRTAILVRKMPGIQVDAANSYYPLNVGGNLRQGVDLIIRSGSARLRLMNVHMKSGCFEEDISSSTAKDCAKLAGQLPALERWVDLRAEEPVPFMLLGDFNRRLSVEASRNYPGDLLTELNDKHPTQYADLKIINEGAPKCWNGRFDAYIDYLLVDPRAAKMVVPGTFSELVYNERSYEDEHKKLSDHCPISMKVVL